MRINYSRPFIAQLVFVVGLLLMLVGIAFLLGSLTDISKKYVLGAFFFVLVGASIAFFAIKLNKRSLYLFFAGFFILVGIFLFLSATGIFPFTFKQAWPLVSVFSGIALIPAGWRKYGRFNRKFVVPALAFLALGLFLMIFSFHIVPFQFRLFILTWWPLIIVLAGLLLVLIALVSKNNPEATGL